MKFIKGWVCSYKVIEPLTFYVRQFDCFIAGGCFKDLLSGRKPNDVDLFFKDSSAYNKAIELIIKNNRYIYVEESELAITVYDKLTGYNIQLIKKGYFKTAEDLLNDFDFTVVQFCLYRDRYGFEVLKHIKFDEHLKNKELVIDNEINTPLTTLLRVGKYAKYGYVPRLKTLKEIALAINECDEGTMTDLYYDEELND